MIDELPVFGGTVESIDEFSYLTRAAEGVVRTVQHARGPHSGVAALQRSRMITNGVDINPAQVRTEGAAERRRSRRELRGLGVQVKTTHEIRQDSASV